MWMSGQMPHGRIDVLLLFRPQLHVSSRKRQIKQIWHQVGPQRQYLYTEFNEHRLTGQLIYLESTRRPTNVNTFQSILSSDVIRLNWRVYWLQGSRHSESMRLRTLKLNTDGSALLVEKTVGFLNNARTSPSNTQKIYWFSNISDNFWIIIKVRGIILDAEQFLKLRCKKYLAIGRHYIIIMLLFYSFS
jgi:hypothetical protein